MLRMIRRIFILLLLLFLGISKAKNFHSREKRFLLFPRTTPTRHNFIVGFGIPLSLEDQAITMGWVMKALYFLPDVSNTFQNFPHFPDIYGNRPPTLVQPIIQEFPNGRRKRETVIDKVTGQVYEKYDGEIEEIGNEELKNSSNSEVYDDDTFEDEFLEDYKFIEQKNLISVSDDDEEEALMDTSSTRWLMYDGLSRLLSSKGLQGKPCVLRGICEAAETKFTHHSGLFGELAHILFAPSTTLDPITNPEHHDYVNAEKLGENGEPCAEIFRECKKSLMDIISQVF